MIPISFDDPRWLLALAAVPVVVLAGRAATAVTRARQQRIATGLRAVAVAALVLALAGPRWQGTGDGVDVAFLVDSSDSVARSQAEAQEWVEVALGAGADGDRAALARFGADARLEHTLRGDLDGAAFQTVVDGSGTDLAGALRLGQGVLGSEQRRRVVLLSDGRATSGDAVETARQLADSGITVDVVPLVAGAEADVLVERVEAPNRVREGESYEVSATLLNTGAASDVVVVVTADGEEIHRQAVTAEPGRTEVVLPRTADDTGTVRYEVRLQSGASTVTENDVGRAAVSVDGPARVLVVEGETGIGEHLAFALRAGGTPTDRLDGTVESLPPLDRLLAYDVVTLVDVPADLLGSAGMQTLDAYVRDAGHGLVVVGGDDSYGMGAYDDTPLEDLLPVFARVKDPKRRPSVAEALVVDVSGSMAACHCRGEGFAGGGVAVEGGVNKTDITREAVARAVDALEQQDLVGVLAFNATAEWVIPLQQLPSDDVVDDALARLHPDGPTNVETAVREAIAGLKDANARLRHIVLFTDGFSENPDLVDVAREAADAGITLSVVGTGEGAGEHLRDMAQAGGGRYYPGRDLFAIPDIIVSEIQFAARPVINEGTFLPTVTALDAPTENLDTSPPLYGYLATTAKPTARQLLQIGEERDPLLASWQAGLGRVVAWTSDAAPRWSRDWVSWERFSGFWSDVVKSAYPGVPDPDFALSATATTGGLEITLESASPVPAGAQGTVTVTAPDGTRREVPLERTGLTSFTAATPGGSEGVYAVSARLGQNGTDLFRDTVTAIRSYSPEYAVGDSDTGLLERIADLTGGRVDPDPSLAFDPAGLAPGSTSRTLWPWLLAVALLTLPADVGLRRLRLERGDLRRAMATLRWRRGAQEAAPETTATTLAADARERRERRERRRVSASVSPPEPPPPSASEPKPDSEPSVPEPPPASGGSEGSAASRLLDAKRRRDRDA